MKKASMVLCSIFIFSSLSFAMPGKDEAKGPHHADKKEREEKMMMMKKDFMEYHKKLEDLIEKYNKAKGKKKDAVVEEIKALVAGQTDKDVAKKKEMLAVQKERIEDFEKKISEIESDKDAYVNKKVNFYISEEGQQKIKEKSINMKKRECAKDNCDEMKEHKGKKGAGKGHHLPPPPPPPIDEEPVY